MNFIYDIMVNFQGRAIEVFDWNKNDLILNIRKIPVYKISGNDLFALVVNKSILDLKFLENTYKKTEYIHKNELKYIDNAFVLCDGFNCFVLKIDSFGLIKGYSCLLYEDCEEIIDFCESLDVTAIKYKTDGRLFYHNFITRYEMKCRNFIKRELKKLCGNEEILNFLYLECFGKDYVVKYNIDDIYLDVINNFDNVYEKLVHFLKLKTSK